VKTDKQGNYSKMSMFWLDALKLVVVYMVSSNSSLLN